MSLNQSLNTNPSPARQPLQLSALTTLLPTERDQLVLIAAISHCGGPDLIPTFAGLSVADADAVICALASFAFLRCFAAPESVLTAAAELHNRIAFEVRMRTIHPPTACREIRQHLSSFDTDLCGTGGVYAAYNDLLTEIAGNC